MLRILVTGSAGKIGRVQVEMLRAAGHEVRTFDTRADPNDPTGEHHFGDLRDLLAVKRAVRGMDAVVHAGAIPSDRRGQEDQVLSVNVQGTWNVLLACVELNVGRVVAYSSVNALGCVGGHRPADRLPIGDDYSRHPMSAYQLSKHLVEETCRSFTNKHGLVTICLRPVYVSAPDEYKPDWRDPDGRWMVNEYFAYVDIRDVCRAALLGLSAENVTHDAFLLTADDTAVTVPTKELVARHYSDVPWMDVDRDAYLSGNPFRSLFDCAHAKQVLGWEPQHSWREAGPTV